MTAKKRVLVYLKGTVSFGLNFINSEDKLIGYTDASWADNTDNRRSTSGNIFISSGAAISRMSKSQSTVALSTAEAEYIVLFDATREATWLRKLWTDITQSVLDPTTIYVDNQSAIAIANNNKSSKRTKHMDIKYHYTRDAVTAGLIVTAHCPTSHMLADIFTKPLPTQRFCQLRELIGVSL
jgi:hypothetical protein